MAMERLEEVFRATGWAVGPEFETRRNSGIVNGRWDAVCKAGDHTFLIECKAPGSLSQVVMAVRQLTSASSCFPPPVIPMVVVPYMGESARNYCEQNGVAWLDLSGNGRIVAPGFFYQDLGHPNRFRGPGRPESAFGTKGSRVARQLLMESGVVVRQRSLAQDTGLNEGYVSRVVGKLVETGLAERVDEGVRVVDANLLLDAWHEEYRFNRHMVIAGHVGASSGDVATRSLAEKLWEFEIPYATTGLSAAWLWTRYAGFRLSTICLVDVPSNALMVDLGFRAEARGANTWLVIPNDEGVLHGASEVEGIRCVHPLQVYLDLKGHPERAQEAAEELRSRMLAGILNDI